MIRMETDIVVPARLIFYKLIQIKTRMSNKVPIINLSGSQAFRDRTKTTSTKFSFVNENRDLKKKPCSEFGNDCKSSIIICWSF